MIRVTARRDNHLVLGIHMVGSNVSELSAGFALALEMGARPLEKARWAGAVDAVGGDILAWLTRTVQQGGAYVNNRRVEGIDGMVGLHSLANRDRRTPLKEFLQRLRGDRCREQEQEK